MPAETTVAQPHSADWADRACESAFKHYHAGLVEEAKQLTIRILERDPSHGRTLYLLALIAINAGDPGLAVELMDQALVRWDHIPACHLMRGQALFRLKRFDDACQNLQRCIQLSPNDADALSYLGHVRKAQERIEEAAEFYRRSLAVRPGHEETLAELGNACRKSLKFTDAIECYEKALTLNPDNALVKNNLALTLGDTNRFEEAAACFEDLVEKNPKTPQIRFNLAQVYSRLNRCEEARSQLEKVIALDPMMVEATIQTGSILFTLGEVAEGYRWNRERLPVARQTAEAHTIALLSLHYDPAVTSTALFAEHREWGRLHAPPCPPRPPVYRDHKRIRVGYVSSDFRRHPVGWFMRPVLDSHDAERFEIYCYSGAHQPDELTAHAREHSTWRETFGWSNAKLTEQMRQDEIDILVDLAGYTAGNRLLAIAERPAPVQVTWLGYPNTTGLTAVDYRLTDAWADPPGMTEHLNSEKLVRLEDGFLCFSPDPASPEPAVPHGPITFGCFNGLPKMSDEVFALWTKILQRVPGSRLFLKTKPFSMETTRRNVMRRLREAGIDPERVVLEGYSDEHSQHLAAYREVDVALDPFPYNGTTTTYDALWMGVPVVALEGETHVSRVSVSVLTRAGHPEWIAKTADEYVDIAVRLAKEARSEKRERLVTAAMMDGKAFTAKLERVYTDLLNQAANGQDESVTHREILKRKIGAIPFWYHKIALPGGIVTPGWAPICRDAYQIPADLTGKRVLDVGAWDGYWTFLALERGAREVVAIDDFSDYLGSLKEGDRKAWATFDLCREALGYDESRCRRVDMSVYDATEERLGRFDVVFFFGTLYHLRHPLLALDRLSAICDGEIYAESAILDDFSSYRGGMGHGYPGQMVMEFYPDKQYGNNDSNWWVPSLLCLAQMVRAAGFQKVEGWKLDEKPASLPMCRGFVKGVKS